jgi:hypothetical protein
MHEKQQQQKEYYIILEKHIRFEKLMIENHKWIGWSKKKKDELLLHQLLQQLFGKITKLI